MNDANYFYGKLSEVETVLVSHKGNIRERFLAALGKLVVARKYKNINKIVLTFQGKYEDLGHAIEVKRLESLSKFAISISEELMLWRSKYQ